MDKVDDLVATLHDQFWVVVTHNNGEELFSPLIGSSSWTTPEEAQAHIDWCLERNADLKQKAEEEDVTKGNMYTYSYNNPRDGKKFDKYRIVTRKVTEWNDYEAVDSLAKGLN